MADDGDIVRTVRERFFQLAIPAGLITGVLYYLGWVHTRALYRELGVRPSQLGFGTTDYILRSLNVLVLAAERVVIIGIVVVITYALLLVFQRRVDQRWSRRVGVVGMVFGLLVGIGEPLVELMDDPVRSASFALVGALMALGGASLLAAGQPFGWLPTRGRLSAQGENQRVAAWSVTVLGLLVVSSTFNLAREWADDQGVMRAIRSEAQPERYPETALVSATPLGLERFGIRLDHDVVAGDDSYRYTGLRVFTEANGKLLVWPCQQFLRDGLVMVDLDLVQQYEQRPWRTDRNEASPLIPAQDAECPTGTDLITREWLTALGRLNGGGPITTGGLGLSGGESLPGAHFWIRVDGAGMLAVIVADTNAFIGRDETLKALAEAAVGEVWFINPRRRLLDIYTDPDVDAALYRSAGRSRLDAPIEVPGLGCEIEPTALFEIPSPVRHACRS